MSKAIQRSLESKLAALKDYDSSDGSDDGEEIATMDIDKKSVTKKKKQNGKSSASSSLKSNVIYLGRIPSQFEEPEMKRFFNQFGTVINARLSRSKKTGRSKGYAFIQFRSPEVAEIVAKTMNNYILMNKRMVCHVLSPDQVYADTMFKRSKNKGFYVDPTSHGNKYQKQVEKNLRSSDKIKQITRKLIKRDNDKKRKLAEMGIDYDFPDRKEVQKKDDSSTSAQKNKKKKRTLSDADDETQKSNIESQSQSDTSTDAPKSSKKKLKKSKKDKKEESKEIAKSPQKTTESEVKASVKKSKKKVTAESAKETTEATSVKKRKKETTDTPEAKEKAVTKAKTTLKKAKKEKKKKSRKSM
eukprot:CAMPEP_0178945590 /NCGR_PEP_ID=MMETSP0789-20121207/3818_1 /TAXON_ID=3005 /ORGANISM="Rhizosolenia setigera, Strain CCMP 1694" /LENGTH=356 /DNA_ID=CAMNT_0020625495 /DNA_START=98 /DNA_END=1168 /DNA_ORIENTATION=+